MPLRSVAFQQFVSPSCAQAFGSRLSGPSLWPQLYPNKGFVLAAVCLPLASLPCPLHPHSCPLGFEVGFQVGQGPWGLKRWVGVIVSFSNGSWCRHLLSLVLLGLAQAKHPWNLPENGPERPLFFPHTCEGRV